jgi:hypothetical protein
MNNIVIAQAKGDVEVRVVQVTTKTPLFKTLDIREIEKFITSDRFPFNGKWAEISNASQQPFFPSFLKPEANWNYFPEICPNQMSSLTWLAEEHEHQVYFQRIVASLTQTSVVYSGGCGTLSEDKKTNVKIHDVPEALYCRDRDRLYYRQYSTLLPILKGLEMTLEYDDYVSFSLSDVLNCGLIFNVSGLNDESISEKNRQRMILIHQDVFRSPMRVKKAIVTQLVRLNHALLATPCGNYIVIRNEDELSIFIDCIEETLYRPDACRKADLPVWQVKAA